MSTHTLLFRFLHLSMFGEVAFAQVYFLLGLKERRPPAQRSFGSVGRPVKRWSISSRKRCLMV
eukprot:645551-Amphidinium_carterae.1